MNTMSMQPTKANMAPGAPAAVPCETKSGADEFFCSPIKLPNPGSDCTCSFHEALLRRHTIRDITSQQLTFGQLSDLLWSACGINRERGPFGAPGRTSASASNSQEIDLYVALETGVYLYDALPHRLIPVIAADLRPLATDRRQGIESRAPVQLIYVVDLHDLTHTKGFDEAGLHEAETYYVDVGLIAANVYLFAAAHGMASWFHNCERDLLKARLALAPEQRVLFAQSVGWPAASEARAPGTASMIRL